jgi:hypothetical protein
LRVILNHGWTRIHTDAEEELSNVKKPTIFPSTWSDTAILDAIKRVGGMPAIARRAADGTTFHRAIVNGVEIEVVKIGNKVTAAYPTGGNPTNKF